jgi:transcriptional regulator with GAF, ATPase, and Fis domain
MDEQRRVQGDRIDGRDSEWPTTELLGNSPAMIKVRELISLVADTNATVLIRGESGTGKELVARSLRARSSRRHKAFVKVNCAALPGELLESEMFGFERGAFSGALQAKPGKFEFANHGTIFLDEIGEMPASLQAKLLHVLQDGQFSRLGGQGDVRVDVRVIAATNRRLEEAVATGLFREDLFFRLNVVCITIPPLRDRREEIPALVRHFLSKYSRHYRRPEAEIPQETLDAFMEHSWPGNVRELENVIQRMILLGPEFQRWTPTPVARPTGERRFAAFERRQASRDSEVVGHPPVPPLSAAQPLTSIQSPVPPAAVIAATTPSAPPPVATANEQASLKLVGRNAARAAERELMLKMLNRTRWNRKEAAEILGISYKALLYKIKEHRLDDPMTDLDPPGRA